MQFALAFLLGVIVTVVVGRHVTMFSRPQPTDRERIVVITTVDVNRAGRPELLQLPGIGPGLADDILATRAELGEFKHVDDLQKVRGLGPKRMEALRPYVSATKSAEIQDAKTSAARPTAAKVKHKVTSSADKIDVNRANATELQMLPGIGPVLAARIISTREREPFRSVDDMRRVPGIGPKTMDKLRPLVHAGDGDTLVGDAR